MTSLQWGALLFLAILWGGSFFLVKVALRELPPFTLVLIRVTLAAAALHVVVLARGERMPSSPRRWASFALLGLLNNLIPFCLISWGQTHIGAGLASVLNATTPMFTVLAAHFMTADEKMTPGKVTGVLICLAGVAVIIGPDALHELGMDVAAQLAVVGASLCYGLGVVFGRRFQGQSPMILSAGQLTWAAALMAPVVLAAGDRPWSLPPPGAATWVSVITLALVSTALAYIIFFRLLASAGATNLAQVTFLIPVTALLLGTFVLGERLAASDFAGIAVILLGLASIDGRAAAFITRRPSPGGP